MIFLYLEIEVKLVEDLSKIKNLIPKQTLI